MSKTFDQGKEEVARLCQYFATNRQAFLAPGAREADVRQSLIDPLFEALGWDVRNTAMTALQYREVIFEDSLDVEGHQKTPDYTFRVGPSPKFYAEAKKCGVNIGADPGPAYQLRRYGWSGKVALSVLTDFEEFGVYDCTMRPRPSDQASHARIQYLRCDEYPDRWRELWDVFSREAVWSGAFDQYAKSKRKRGTSEVDVEFLKEIEGWRDDLARDIALRNKGLSLDDLNAAVQLTIDRVVFLRMAEDRGLEPYGQLLKLCERPGIYPRLMAELCRRADQKYNSGLFHFQKESGVSEDPDRITPKLTVDDRVFKPILESLYFEHGSPYHFGLLPVEILGTVYERFLGKVIRLTAGHQAKVEEKPEVRKAGGVYYTPAYIVEYIVKHTVGRQIEARSPAQLAGDKDKPPFRVLDMACGSGSFLLGAYQCLLDYCLKWYIEHRPETCKKAVYKDPRNGEWRLTIEEKKRILTTHVFGVDIDSQAVEVTKLSLLLKVLEGETDQSFSLSQLPFGDRALPNLADNIKRGNSLVGPHYFTGKLIADPDEMKRVNPFDWSQGFPDAMKAGGFDCVIGNPPYGMVGDEGVKSYYTSSYRTIEGRLDNYALFIERGLLLSRPRALLGYIVPSPFLSNLFARQLRRFVKENFAIQQITNFGMDVFRDPTVHSCIVVISNTPPKDMFVSVRKQVTSIAELKGPFDHQISQGSLGASTNTTFDLFINPLIQRILASTTKECLPLGDCCFIRQCIKTGDDEKLVKTFDTPPKEPWKPTLRGRSINRYETREQRLYVKYGPWLARNWKNITFYERSKIAVRETGKAIVATLDRENRYFLSSLYAIYPKSDQGEHWLEYLLGIMNSRLATYFVKALALELTQGAFTKMRTNQLGRLPLRMIRLSDPSDKARHDQMVGLVTSMLGLHKQLAAAKSAAERGIIQRQSDATDAEIDRLVYDLYGLTADEIATVEGKDQ